MCSVRDGSEPIKRSHVDARLRTCMKCKTGEAVVITRVNDAYCRACFQVYVTHKFRAAIGKTKLVRDGEMVLVAFSGGYSSSALLHLVQQGLSQSTHKKLRFKPGVIFIDEGATVNMGPEERLAVCEKIQSIAQASGFPCYIRALEEGLDLDTVTSNVNMLSSQSAPDVFTNAQTETSKLCCNDETDSLYSSGTASVTLPEFSPCTSPVFREDSSSPGLAQVDVVQSRLQIYDHAEDRLKQTLASMKSVSAKEDLIRSLRHNILLETARHYGYSKVMLGDCGTRLAVRLLTDIATGRGSHAAMETAFADKRHEDVMFVRPMRDFSSKEVAMYNSMHGVEMVVIQALTTKASAGASIEHLTESFVTGLQTDYPATVSNIMRTGEKLDANVDRKVDRYCAMCQTPLDTSVGASSALSAVEFSLQISRDNSNKTKTCNSASSSNQCCGSGQCLHSNRPSPEDVLANLCYGCRLVVRDMDDVYKLPSYVLKDVSWRSRRSKMMSEIKDFLIEES